MSSPFPVRLPRSLHESPAYNPEWRRLQVEEYLRCRRHHDDQDGPFVLSSSERDSTVRAYFKFRTNEPTTKAAAFRYAQDCIDTNDRYCMASRLKAMTTAGLTTTEIADRLHTSPENIESFQSLFFDVRSYVQDRAALRAILAPMTDVRTADTRERVWLLAALSLGENGLDYVMDQRVRLTGNEQKEISDAIHCILAEQSLGYTLSLDGKAEAGAKAVELYQRNVELRLRYPVSEDDEKCEVFTRELLRIAVESRAEVLQAQGGAN